MHVQEAQLHLQTQRDQLASVLDWYTTVALPADLAQVDQDPTSRVDVDRITVAAAEAAGLLLEAIDAWHRTVRVELDEVTQGPCGGAPRGGRIPGLRLLDEPAVVEAPAVSAAAIGPAA